VTDLRIDVKSHKNMISRRLESDCISAVQVLNVYTACNDSHDQCTAR